MSLTASLAQTIKTIEGNGLAVFINEQGVLMLKDVHGQLATVQSFISGGGGSSDLTVGTTPILSGGLKRVLFEGAGNILQESSNFVWDYTNNRLGVGTSDPDTDIAVQKASADVVFQISGTSDFDRKVKFSSLDGGSNLGRFSFKITGNESGSDAGSDLYIERYDDAGDVIANAMFIERATGFVGVNTSSPAGFFHIFGASSTTNSIIDASNNIDRNLQYRTDDVIRWNLNVTGDETGSNAGANIAFNRYSDGGALIDAALSITRSNGRVVVLNNANVGGVLAQTARLDVVGSSDVSGSALYIGSLSNEAYRIYNNRTIVYGGSSAAASTHITVNNVGGSSGSSTYAQQWIGSGGDNIVRISNNDGSNTGGIQILRTQASTSRTSITVAVGSTTYFNVMSNGMLYFPTRGTWFDDGTAAHIQYVNTAAGNANQGLWFNIETGSEDSFVFHKSRSSGAISTAPFMRWFSTFTDSGQPITGTQTMLRIDPTTTFTGSGSINLVGIEYNPTLTNINGVNYALLMKSGRNGFGLGSTLPTAIIDITGSTTGVSSLRMRSGTAPSSPNDGDDWYTGTVRQFRVGSTTRTYEFTPVTQTVNATTATTTIDLSLAQITILNLQTATTALTLTNPAVGTYIIKVKQDATGSRLLTYTTIIAWAGGSSPTLTTTANYSDVITLVYDGTNLLATFTANFNV